LAVIEKLPIFASQQFISLMNGDQTERLPQEGKCRENGEDSILEEASAFARRVLEEIEALAGTTACKSVQLVRLKKWAQEKGCWFGMPEGQVTDTAALESEIPRIVYHLYGQSPVVSWGLTPLCGAVATLGGYSIDPSRLR